MSFSGFINSVALLSISSIVQADKNSASGSNPASLAMVAFVRFFCLNGR